jgi:hypothetical protein
MMRVLIIVLIGVVCHGPPGRELNTQPSFTRGQLPLAAPKAPVTLSISGFEAPDWTGGHVISIRIVGKGPDPGSLMHLKLVTVTRESFSYQVFHSFYEEMRNEFSISTRAKNLFLSLAESIAQILNVTSCYVCGGTNMGEHWPWKAREPDPWEPLMRLLSQNTGKASGS